MFTIYKDNKVHSIVATEEGAVKIASSLDGAVEVRPGRPTYITNAFSLQMVDFPANIHVEEVPSLPSGLVSAVGHQDTANVLGVPMNRINIHLEKGDTLYVAQLMGGRLPEGATTLPEGFHFKFIKVELKENKKSR